MNKKKSILLLSLSFVLTCGVAAFFVGSNNSNILAQSTVDPDSCVHSGYHYAGHENSLIKNGNKEFWACCRCHTMHFTNPGGTWVDKSQYDYDLKDTDAYLPSYARDIGNLSSATTLMGQLDDYAFEYYSISGYAQHFLKDNVNISRYQKVTFAIKSETLWFIVQDPTWSKSLPFGNWYQIVLDQSSTDTWDIYIGKLGEDLHVHVAGFEGNDLKTIVRLGSDSGSFYITNFLAYYKETEIVGTKVDECLFTANGAETFKSYENVPSGFEQVRVTNSKTTSGSFFSGELYSAVDLSSYSKVKFAVKAMGYFLCNNKWNQYVNASKDWLIFELTKSGTYLWNLVISNYNGQVYYSENNLNGDMGTDPGVYTTNSLNAILYGKKNGFFAAKWDGIDLKVYSTEIRAYSTLTINNSYKIIYQGDDKNCLKASQDIMDRIGRITSWSIYLNPAISESETYSDEAKIISVGDTNYARTSGITPDTDMGLDGYAVVTKGNSIIITANSSRGIAPAVKYFIEEVLGYECYAQTSTDTVTSYVKRSTIEVLPLNVYSKPATGIRQITANEGTMYGGNRLNLGYSFDNNGAGHVTTNVHTLSSIFLPYDTYRLSHYRWYSKSGSEIQLCYSARGNASEYNAMKQELANEIEAKIENYEMKTVYADLSIRDNWHQCNCSKCQEEIAKYGSYGAQILHFVSEVADIVDEWAKSTVPDKTIKYITLAYQQAQEPPTSLDYDLNENVITYFASPNADFSIPYSEGVNKQYYDQLIGWANLYKNLGYKDNLWFWVYDNQTQCYMYPYNDFEMSQPLIQLLSSLDVSAIHIETPFVTRVPCFEDLNVYVKGKLLNNANINYEETVNNFMINYYGAASAYMKSYYEQIKGVIQVNVDGSIWGVANKKEYWPIDTVTSMIAKLDSCLDAAYTIEDETSRTAITDRIHRERITPIFILLEHYVDSHTYSKDKMTNLLNEFKTYTTKYGITYFNHNTTLDARITSFTNAVNNLSY